MCVSLFKYYRGVHALWPFGHGLSYATWAVTDPDAAAHATATFAATNASFALAFHLDVQRTDACANFQAQLTLTACVRPLDVPGLTATSTPVALKQLVSFVRTADVYAGGTASADLSLTADAFALADAAGDLSVWPGTYRVELWDGGANALVTNVSVTGDAPRLVQPFPKAATAAA